MSGDEVQEYIGADEILYIRKILPFKTNICVDSSGRLLCTPQKGTNL